MSTLKTLLNCGIPENIAYYFEKASIIDINKGRIDTSIVKMFDPNHGVIYIKCASDWLAQNELKHELEILPKLAPYLIVPKVVYQRDDSGVSCIALTEIAGQPAHEASLSIDELVLKINQALNVLQNIEFSPADKPTEIMSDLNNIVRFIEYNEINEASFAAENQGRSPQDILSELYALEKDHSIKCFTHGDFCLPNLIINNSSIGLIDWGQAGFGDPIRDVAAMVGSLFRNFGQSSVDVFKSAVGLSNSSKIEQKIYFYKMIDQFFYHRNV